MRRARIETSHDDAETAQVIAAALTPDNTAEMQTTVDGATVTTTIDRETTGGLQSTADDYVVNLEVAAQLANRDGAPSTDNPDT
ncbi:KEOPS complex subunit Pcc1 [Halobacteriales archaeon Cl-PHB]